MEPTSKRLDRACSIEEMHAERLDGKGKNQHDVYHDQDEAGGLGKRQVDLAAPPFIICGGAGRPNGQG